MTNRSKLVRQNPPAAHHNRKGKTPTILTDEKVETLLSTPNEWYLIATCDNWVSGVKQNIESMNQTNIRHLKDVGEFEIKQRKNDDGYIDIYCRFIKLQDVDNTF
tara:strand:- start:334 stop:648 length:315 start_codon:yes stop_codon:yes gene_type:complete